MTDDFSTPPKYLKLVKNPSFSDKMAKSAFIKFLKLRGIREKPPSMSFDESKDNYNVFRIQSYSYEENGEKIYRNIECKEKLIDSIENITTLPELINNCFKENGNKPYMGVRPLLNELTTYDKNGKPAVKYSFGEYEWLTYAECKIIMDNLSTMFIQADFNMENKMALFTDTSHIWLLVANSLFQLKSPVVTIYSTLSDENIIYALNLTEVQGILVDKKSVPRLMSFIRDIPSIRFIYYTHEGSLEAIKNAIPVDRNIVIKYINPKELKKNNISEDEAQRIKTCLPSASDDALIMFTSGSTGRPKGVVITHENVVSAISITISEKDFWNNKKFLAYLPQSHILEFIAENVITLNGGSLGYGHPLTLFDNSPMIQEGTRGDLSALKPTFFATVPLLLERVKKGVIDKLERTSSIKRIVFETAYNIKLNYFKAGIPTPFLDEKVFKKLREFFGGHATHAYIGGASLNVDTEDFINICFGLFKMGYGLTETCCAGSLSNLDYWRTGSAGPITKCVELKLIPWEEGGYFPNDPKGPRGEILLSGKSIVKGYYKNEEATREAFITDEVTGKKWFKTGDVGQILPDGTLRIIDRKKDIAKLKHGEYVSLVYIEQSIVQIKYVDLVCACPNKESEHIVALIVPNRQYVKEFLAKLGNYNEKEDIEDVLKSMDIKNFLSNEVKKSLKEMNTLDKYQMPKEIIIVNDLWTPDSGLLTPSAKLRRPIIYEKYKDLIR